MMMLSWCLRGLLRACAIVIAVHAVSVLMRGDAAWRGFWFGLASTPAWFEAACELALAAAILSRRRVARVWIAVMAGVALVDAHRTFGVFAAGGVVTALPVPLSLGLGIGLAMWAWRPPVRRHWGVEMPAVALGLALVPSLWIAAFGLIDYRRPADAAVVLGAKAYRDLTPSLALYDRTRTGLELYEQGMVDELLFSGGAGEPETMWRMASEAGIPEESVILDAEGLNTRSTARNLARISRERGWTRVLAVSHYYHLPRLKMACRQEGIDVRTVPCRMSRRLVREPYFLARETVAFYAYLLGADSALR